MSSGTSTQHSFQLMYSCTYILEPMFLGLTRVMYVLHDSE